MKVVPTGIVFYGICHVQTPKCVAKSGAPVTAVWTPPGRTQVNVCKPCLDEQIRQGRWIVEGARVQGMKPQVDLAVYSSDAKLQLIVEIKNKLRSSPDWAKRIYSEFMHNPVLSKIPYFMLALPDYFYLWKQGEGSGHADPDFDLAPRKFLEPYLTAHSLSMHDIGVSLGSEFKNEPYVVVEKHFLFQSIVKEWLLDIVAHKNDFPDELQLFFVSSGLYEKIENGFVEAEALIDEGDILSKSSNRNSQPSFDKKFMSLSTA